MPQLDDRVRYLEIHLDARALLLGIGECTHKDPDGWMWVSARSPGFKTLPKELYEVAFPDAGHSAGVRVRLTPPAKKHTPPFNPA